MKLRESILLDPSSAVAPEGVATTTTATPPASDATPAPGVLDDPDMGAAFEDPFAGLDSKVKPKTPPTDDKKDVTPKPDAKAQPKPEDKKVDTKPKVEPKKTDAIPEDKTVHAPKALKEHNAQLLKELKEEREAKRQIELKIKSYESKELDTTKLAQQLAEKDKEIAKIKGDLGAAKFTVSDEFKTKHQIPWERAAAHAKLEIETLQVPVEKDENGNVIKTRPAQWDEFAEIFRLPTGQALAAIRKLFGTGDEADVAKKHLFDLQGRQRAWNDAVQEERGSWQKKQQEAEAAQIREREHISSMWEKVNADIVAKNPELYGEIPDDAEGNELLKEGYRIVDSAYGSENLTPEQKVVLDANIRNRAAAFGRERYLRLKAEARSAELEEKLAGKKGTLPGAVRRDGDNNIPEPETDLLKDPQLEEAFRG